MSFVENIITRILKKGTIVYKSQLSKTVYHIRVQSDSFKNIEYIPGDFLRVFVGEGKAELSFKEKIRSYSVWHFNKEKCEIDIAATIHGNGPGANWAAQCKVGDSLHFNWHKGKFIVDNSADDYVFIGDLSALSQFYEFNRNLIGKNSNSIIYSQHNDDFFADIDSSKPFEFHVLSKNPSDEILKRLETLKPTLKNNTKIYVAGDSRVCVAVTQHLRKNWKWSNHQIKAKPYWNPEKRGLE